VSLRIEVIARPKLRHAWFWWAVGWLLVAMTINQSLQRHVIELAQLFPSDKVVHFLGYFGLALWFSGVTERKRYPVVGLLLVVLGGALELTQGAMHAGRTADWLDFLANSLGIATALGIAAVGLGMWAVWIERLFGFQK